MRMRLGPVRVGDAEVFPQYPPMRIRLEPVVRIGDVEVLPQFPPPRMRLGPARLGDVEMFPPLRVFPPPMKGIRLGPVRVGDAEVPSLRLLSRVPPLPLL